MIGCIRCHGPLLPNRLCPMCDKEELDAMRADSVEEPPVQSALPHVSDAPLPSEAQAEALIILIEECAEVQKVACKIARFGADDTPPGESSINKVLLAGEIGDLVATAHLCMELGLLTLTDVSMGVRRKFRRLQHYLRTGVAREALKRIDINDPKILEKVELPWALRVEQLHYRLNNQADTIQGLQKALKTLAEWDDFMSEDTAQAMLSFAREERKRLLSWKPTHRHLKTGRLYREIRRGLNEADMKPVVAYDDQAGRMWVRPVVEFDDGRFAPLTGD